MSTQYEYDISVESTPGNFETLYGTVTAIPGRQGGEQIFPLFSERFVANKYGSVIVDAGPTYRVQAIGSQGPGEPAHIGTPNDVYTIKVVLRRRWIL